ncbi:hypothetical protein L2X98_31275 [Microbacterium elymi]|uniref:Uncharacterized protein n=1 Tax=Microbacterium elymi TaxID=2909587 RepID=A0ABY5NIB4_9MICO|nr:hypothetical protein [Microbacterium elymi]UUT34893.1 hypothetical protein L2X98_31275 [Microbacterium elymi]
MSRWVVVMLSPERRLISAMLSGSGSPRNTSRVASTRPAAVYFTRPAAPMGARSGSPVSSGLPVSPVSPSSSAATPVTASPIVGPPARPRRQQRRPLRRQ